MIEKLNKKIERIAKYRNNTSFVWQCGRGNFNKHAQKQNKQNYII
jgi:hypothetical protein